MPENPERARLHEIRETISIDSQGMRPDQVEKIRARLRELIRSGNAAEIVNDLNINVNPIASHSSHGDTDGSI